MRSTTVLLATCLALLVGLAAGCGGDDDDATEPAPQQTTEDDGAAGGGASAGAEVFASAGCGTCHTLSAADASGTVGPNLDEVQLDVQTVVDQVTNGGGGMPAFGDQLSEQEIQDVAAFVSENAGG